MKALQAATTSIMLAPAASATTERTANLDIAGAKYASITCVVSAEANTNSTNVLFALLESDDTTATNFATFNSSYNVTIDNTAAAFHRVDVDTRGRKRYLRVRVTPDTTTNGAVLSSCTAAIVPGLATTASSSVAG